MENVNDHSEAEIVKIEVYLCELLDRCNLSLMMSASLGNVVKEGTSQLQLHKFSSVAEKRWDCIRSLLHFDSHCWLNFLKDLPSHAKSLQDTALKLSVKGAMSIVSERVQEVARMLESHKKLKATYKTLCDKIEIAAATSIVEGQSSAALSKVLQGSCSDFHRIEKSLDDLTEECNAALLSLKTSATGWLDDIREIEVKRLIWNREALDNVITGLEQSITRRSEIYIKSRESIRTFEECLNKEDDEFENSMSLMRAPVSGLSDGMAVDILESRAEELLAWTESRHLAFSQAHWLLTGCLQDERAYIKVVDRVLSGYGFDLVDPPALPANSNATISASLGQSVLSSTASGVESFFNKIKEGIDARVWKEKGIFEKLRKQESPCFRDAWTILFRVLRRSGPLSFVNNAENVLKKVTAMLVSLDALRTALKKTFDEEKANLTAVRTRSDIISSRKQGNEASIVDLLRALDRMNKIKIREDLKEVVSVVEKNPIRANQADPADVGISGSEEVQKAHKVDEGHKAKSGDGDGDGDGDDDDDDALLLGSALQLSSISEESGGEKVKGNEAQMMSREDLTGSIGNGNEDSDGKLDAQEGIPQEITNDTNAAISVETDTSFDGNTSTGGGGNPSVGFAIGIDNAAVKMGMMSVENSVQRIQKKLDALQASVQEDEVALAEVANVYEKALEKAFSTLSKAFGCFFQKRKLLLDEGSKLVIDTLEVYNSSLRGDRELLSSLKSKFNAETVATGEAFFFGYCNGLDTGSGSRTPGQASTRNSLEAILSVQPIQFMPCGTEFVMSLRSQRLLPPIMHSTTAEEAKSARRYQDSNAAMEIMNLSDTIQKDDKKLPEEGINNTDQREIEADGDEKGDTKCEPPIQDISDISAASIAPISVTRVDSAISDVTADAETDTDEVWRDNPTVAVDGASISTGMNVFQVPTRNNCATSSQSRVPVVRGQSLDAIYSKSDAAVMGALASPAVDSRRTIDMQTASTMAREQSANRGRSASTSAIKLPALYPKEDLMLATDLALPGDQRIIAYYSCCTFPQPWVLVQGTMYITQKFVCFRGWPDTACKMKIAMIDIRRIEKENTALVIPNAIRIYLLNNEEILFSSFIDRDPCYMQLSSSIEAEKHYARIQAEEAVSNSSLRSVQQEVAHIRSPLESPHQTITSTASAAAVIEATVPLRDVGSSEDLSRLTDTPGAKSENQMSQSLPRVAKHGNDDEVQTVPFPHQGITGLDSDGVLVEESLDHRDLKEVFEYRDVTLLLQKDIPVSSASLWEACWASGKGYEQFLTQMGDFDICIDEWTLNGLESCPEDSTDLSFCGTRSCSYSHPRSTMLMFGPKNAPAMQKQYLYLQGKGKSSILKRLGNRDSNTTGIASDCLSLLSGCILTVTQFDGIPMADVFKVLQYWQFEPCKSAPTSHTTVRSGFSVYYIKSSLFRSQISSGVQEELTEQVHKWVAFAKFQGEAVQRSFSARNDSALRENSEADDEVGIKEEYVSPPRARQSESPPKSPANDPTMALKDTKDKKLALLTSGLFHYFADGQVHVADATLVLVLIVLLMALVLFMQNRALQSTLAEHKRLLGELSELKDTITAVKHALVKTGYMELKHNG